MEEVINNSGDSTGKIGRPKEDIYKKYVEGKEQIIIADCRNGADLGGLAKRLGCGKTTINKLKKRYPEFKELIKEGKEVADLNVESSLYKRANGFDYEEVTTKVLVNKDGTGTTTYVEKVKKYIPPDTAAAFIWLKNRKPKEWRDKQEIVHSFDPFLELMIAASSPESTNDNNESNG
jgi:hypothetical protein